MQIVAAITDSYLANDGSPVDLSRPTFQWTVYDETGQRSGEYQHGDLTALNAAITEVDGERHALHRLVILLGAEFFRIATVNVPRARAHRMSRLVAFTMEESIAEDIEQQHIVFQRVDNSTTVRCVAISREHMDSMRSWLHSLKVDRLILMPDGLAVLTEGERQLWVTSEERVLYVDAGAIFATRRSTLPGLLSQLAAPVDGELSEPAAVTLIASATGAEEEVQSTEAELQRHGIGFNRREDAHLLDRAAVSIGDHEALNLVQGAYKPPLQLSRQQKLATRIAAVLAVVWLLHIGSEITLGAIYTHRTTSLQARTGQVVAGYVKVDPHLDLLRQLKGLVRVSHVNTSGTSFVTLYSGFITALKKNNLIGNAQPESIRFQGDKGILTADLSVPSIQFGDKVIAALSRQSLNGKLVSASRQKQGAAIRVDVSPR